GLADCGLEARGDGGSNPGGEPSGGLRRVDREPHRRLEPAEAEVDPLPAQRPRECEAARVAGLGEGCEGGPARIRQGQQPGDLVERLRSEEHTSELQSRENLVCRLLLEKKKK